MRTVLVVFLLGTLLGLTGCTTTGAADPKDPPVVTACETAGNPAWVDTVRTLLDKGETDTARQIVEGVLEEFPQDACAVRALGEIDTTAGPDPTPAQSVGKGWKSFFDDQVSPLTTPLLTALGVIVVLLVVSRLLTGVAVGPGDIAWPRWARTATLWLGAGLVALAGVGTVVAGLAPKPPTGSPALIVQILTCVAYVLTVLAAAVWALATTPPSDSPEARHAGHRLLGVVTLALLAIFLGGVVVLAVAATRPPGRIIVPSPSAAVLEVVLACAVLGVGLLATATGQSLRLVLDVAGPGSDASSAPYVLARLRAMGSTAPRGIEVPRDADVTSLPKEALTTLPTDAVSKAVVTALTAARPGIPWRATITQHGTDAVSVALHRNGRAAGDPFLLTRSALRLPAPTDDAGKARTTSCLLTGAAAYLLLELSERHTHLRTGLCGATDPRSLTLVAVAGDQNIAWAPAERTRLRTAAVALDPDNGLAAVADIGRVARDGAIKNQQLCATLANRLFKRFAKRAGYETLTWRLAMTETAARLNVRSALNSTSDTALLRKAVERLADTLRQAQPTDAGQDELLEDVKASATTLIAIARTELDETSSWPPKWVDAPTDPPRSPFAAYQLACRYLLEKEGTRDLDAAELLRLAFVDDTLEEWAGQDPMMEVVLARKNLDPAVRDLLAAQVDPWDEQPLAAHKADLAVHGVHSADELRGVSARTLAPLIGVPASIIRRWQEKVRGPAEEPLSRRRSSTPSRRSR